MIEPSPYRLPIVKPVCARCKHRADAKVMDKEEPWRDWLCLAVEKVIFREEYNPITGITTPAKMGYERCVKVNGKGDCDKFVEASVDEAKAPAPASEPVTIEGQQPQESGPASASAPTSASKRDWSCTWLPWRK